MGKTMVDVGICYDYARPPGSIYNRNRTNNWQGEKVICKGKKENIDNAAKMFKKALDKGSTRLLFTDRLVWEVTGKIINTDLPKQRTRG